MRLLLGIFRALAKDAWCTLTHRDAERLSFRRHRCRTCGMEWAE